MNVRLVSVTPNPESVIAYSARVSHRSKASEKGSDQLLIQRLIALGHESVVEHAVATFEINGISRACANQLTRHRIASFTQESQRYVDVRVQPMVRPPSFSDEDWEKASAFYAQAMELYTSLLSRGVPREDARFVIPLGAATRLVLTANFREFRHILKLRLDKTAQWEIRQVAEAILRELMQVAPSVFQDIAEWYYYEQQKELDERSA